VVTYPGLGLDEIKIKVYYVPTAQDQVAFDSFIVANGKLFKGIFPSHGIICNYCSICKKLVLLLVLCVCCSSRAYVGSQPQEPELTEMKLFSAATDPNEIITWSLFRLYVY
jgi:hypothetical protein